jgi:pimeloyl-ACP methyl ester carboxylesterase
MTTDHELPLHEAAASSGVSVVDRRFPVSRHADVGIRLHYLDWGNEEQPCMLCVHGSAQNAHMWDFTALAFCDRYHIVALDQRGHGDSDWAPNGEYDRTSYVGDLEKFVDTLGVERIVLMGLSMGGSNSIAYAATHPERVGALVVVDVGPEAAGTGERAANDFVTQRDVLDTYEEFVQRVIKYSQFRPEWHVRSTLRHSLKQLPDGRWTWKYDPVLRDPTRRAQRQSARQDPETRWALWERIACPTLIVRGQQSNMLSGDVADKMVERNGNSRLIEIANAGHRVPGDNPPAFEKAVRSFLNEVDRR